MTRPLAVIVLAAGLGKRTNVRYPKVLLPLCGRSLLTTVLDSVALLGAARTVVVLHHQKDLVEQSLAGRDDLTIVDQGEPRGTGHAVQVAMATLQDFEGDVVICYGDMPLLTPETFLALIEGRGAAAGAILTAFPDDPAGLGRIFRDEDGALLGIREQKDCSEDELEIDEINVGIHCYDAAKLRPMLAQLSDDNAQGELYLTDVVELLLAAGDSVEGVVLADEDEALGVNSLVQLAIARNVMQERILTYHLLNGVIIEDPTTVVIDYGVTIGSNTRILPYTVIRAGVHVGEDCEIGPFTHLRVGAVLDDRAEVGNFVEMKQSRLGSGSKAKHLTYLGDTEVGVQANIGAGTITANYDGTTKHRTQIGDGAFIGSGTVLVAPVVVAANALTGAGAVVRAGSPVGEGETWVGVPARSLGKGKSK